MSPGDAARRRRSCSTRETSSSVSALGAEREEVVDAVLLLVDRVGELAPPPGSWRVERPAALLDQRRGRRRRSRSGAPLPARGRAAATSRSRSRVSLSPSFGLSRPRRVKRYPGNGRARRGRKPPDGSSASGYDGLRAKALRVDGRARGPRSARALPRPTGTSDREHRPPPRDRSRILPPSCARSSPSPAPIPPRARSRCRGRSPRPCRRSPWKSVGRASTPRRRRRSPRCRSRRRERRHRDRRAHGRS